MHSDGLRSTTSYCCHRPRQTVLQAAAAKQAELPTFCKTGRRTSNDLRDHSHNREPTLTELWAVQQKHQTINAIPVAQSEFDIPAAPILLPKGPWKAIEGSVNAPKGFKAQGQFGCTHQVTHHCAASQYRCQPGPLHLLQCDTATAES